SDTGSGDGRVIIIVTLTIVLTPSFPSFADFIQLINNETTTAPHCKGKYSQSEIIMKSEASVIIVGAGISGLSAAYELQKAGHDVILLEGSDHVGGRMTTVDWGGFKVDIGAKFVTTTDKSLLEMVRMLGLEDQLVRDESGLTITIYRNDKLHSANFLSIPSYFGWSGVSLRARLAMFKLIPHFLKMIRLKNVYHLEQAPGPDLEETYEQFFYNRISEEMFEYWAIPMFEVMCSYSGEDVSSKAFLAMMVAYMNAKSVTFQDGVGVLPITLAERFEIELNSRVKRIEVLPDGSGAKVRYEKDGSEKAISASSVIVAIPGNYVLNLFELPRPAWQQFFPHVNYSTGALHYHIVETDYQPEVVGVFIPRSTKLPISGVGFEQYKDGRWLMISDPSIYTFSMDKPEEQLNKEAVETASMIFPEIKGKFVDHRIFRWREKVPTFRPGYLGALAKFWEDPQEGPIYFCGDYFAGPSTGGALYTGKECAARLLADG
ncbi:MAG: NAD(P)/FAD-dependent oxidoreductase, partial [Anaerolineales bacterium]